MTRIAEKFSCKENAAAVLLIINYQNQSNCSVPASLVIFIWDCLVSESVAYLPPSLLLGIQFKIKVMMNADFEAMQSQTTSKTGTTKSFNFNSCLSGPVSGYVIIGVRRKYI